MHRFHISILLVGLIAAGGLVYTYFFISPYDNGQINPNALLIFLSTLGLTIISFISLISYRVKLIFRPFCDPRQTTRNCLRQATWIGGGVVFLILLSITHTLNPLTAILTVVTLVSLEMFFQ